MQKTTIYVASSRKEFEQEKTEIAVFVRRLNDCYVDKGLYFSLATTEDVEHAIELAHDRDGKDKTIAGSSIALFLFGSEADEETMGDFSRALEISKKSGQPKVALYLKSLPDGASESADIKPLKDRLAIETDFYHNTYEHIDTLILGLLMQIKQLKLPGMDIKLEGNVAYQGGDALASFERAEILSGYKELQRLKTERAELEDSFYTAKANYAENPQDAELFEKYREAANRRAEANKTIADIENQLYQIVDGMFEQTAKGRLSRRQVESYRLIERGNLEAARRLLDFDEILSDVRHDESIVEEAAGRAQVNVNELLQLKDVNAAMLDWEGVGACFREAARIEDVHDLPRKAALDYLWYLYEQMQLEKAVELGERLMQHYRAQGSGASNEDKSTLYHRLGIAYLFTERVGDAVEMFKTALALRTVRTDGDPDDIQEDIAATYSNLGVAYKRLGKYAEALEAYRSALEIRKKLAKSNPDKFEMYLTHCYNNLGSLFGQMENNDEAVANLTASRELISKLLAKKENEELERVLSICCSSLGLTYIQMERYDEAESQFTAALETLSKLAEANPDAYEPRIAYSLENLGNLFTKAKRYAEAEEKLNASMEIFSRYLQLADSFETDIADVHYYLGVLFVEMKRYTEAESALHAAVRLYGKYKESDINYATQMDEAQRLIEKLDEERNYVNQDMIDSGMTQAEMSMARLLLNGESRSYITRHLHISAAEYNAMEKSIRQKMNAAGGKDIAISAIAGKYKLTSRETDMLRYLVRAAGNDVIAAELHLSDATVRRHIRNLLDKLSISQRQDVAEWVNSQKE